MIDKNFVENEDSTYTNQAGQTAWRGTNNYFYFFHDDAGREYCRLLSLSPYSRLPRYIKPILEDGVLALVSGERKVYVMGDDWEALKQALVEIHFARGK